MLPMELGQHIFNVCLASREPVYQIAYEPSGGSVRVALSGDSYLGVVYLESNRVTVVED